jgi:glycosyltransferase involved in cell wall biosynthesis
MRVLLNGWFADRPDTGSGQYTRLLVDHLRRIAPEHEFVVAPPPGARSDWRKVWFEQAGFPRQARAQKADLLHVPYWGSPLSAPIPTVVTVHDLIPLLLSDYRGSAFVRLYTGLVSGSARGAQAIITDSEASRQDIIAHLGVPEERVHAIHLAAGERYQPRVGALVDQAVRRKYELPEQYVLYLGGFDRRKNVTTLLLAYTYVAQAVGEMYPLILAGKPPPSDSPLFPDLHGYSKELGLGDSVRFIGEVEEDEKPALYRGAACFAYPSRYEGFGLPPLEAMACGTPVVAAEASSLPEVVGGAGFLVDPDDAVKMAGAVLGILVQPELAETLRQKSLEQAARFSWEQTARETLTVYEQVLARTRP